MKTPLPTLVVDNATDVDQDVLTYQFEIDKQHTFDSPALKQSDNIPEGGEGTTSWTPTSLDENTTYYWRARACDEEDECGSFMTTACFLVNTINEAPSIPKFSTPPDGAVVTIFQPVLEVTNAGDADGDPLTYRWDFGDGAMGTGPKVSHAYKRPGTFTVHLRVSDGTNTACSESLDKLKVIVKSR